MRRPYDFETISEVDVVRELARFINSSVSDENGNNGALKFASELTGMSEDLLLELIDDEEDDYCPSSTNGDYSPSNPWDAPGMSIRDFI